MISRSGNSDDLDRGDVDMGEEKTLGAKQVATRIGTDPKTFRKFLRQRGQGVGQGRRYDFPTSELPKIAQEFRAWATKRVEPKSSPVTAVKSTPRGRQAIHDDGTTVELISTPKRARLKPGETPQDSPFSDDDLEEMVEQEMIDEEYLIGRDELDDEDLEELDFGDEEEED